MNYDFSLDEAPFTWLAITVKRPNLAERRLEAQGYEVYWPQCITPSGRIESLFPGYIFAGAIHHVIRHIRNTPGVRGIVRGASESPTPVPQEFIDAIRAREEDGGYVRIQGPAKEIHRHGDRVKVLGGQFDGHSAIFDEPSGHKRSLLLMYLFGAERKVQVENEFIGVA